MKIIKKDIKLLIGIIIGILISGSVVIAESIIEANHIKYSNSKTEKTNVQDAIDELYELSENLKNNNFASLILKNNQVINKEPTLTTSSNNTSDESGLYKSTDTNSGTTYYFRGNVENNYLSFAGFTWRIVRINEDGTIRIVMQDGINNTTTYAFNTNYNSYAYMYYTNSQVKATLESWYQANIGSKSNLASKIATGAYYCEQAKVKADSSWTSGNATMTAYSSYRPNFKCTADGNNKGLVNASIGLLTYDEVVYAGGYYGQGNSNYYLYNSTAWWTMSPAGLSDSVSVAWNVYPTGYINNYAVDAIYPIRAVLNLKPDTQISSGDGTKNNPYILS